MRDLPKIERLRSPVDFYGKAWPVVLLTKDDLKAISHREWSDEEMEKIAGRVGEALMECFWEVLREVVREMKKGGVK